MNLACMSGGTGLMESSPISCNPSSRDVLQKDAPPKSDYPCKKLNPNLHCQIRTLGKPPLIIYSQVGSPLPRSLSKAHPASRNFTETIKSLVILVLYNTDIKPYSCSLAKSFFLLFQCNIEMIHFKSTAKKKR